MSNDVLPVEQVETQVNRGLLFASSVASSRIILGVLIAHLSQVFLPRGTWHMWGGSWLAGFAQWDGGWYLGIVHSGYSYSRQTVFFPGFPLSVDLVRIVSFHTLSLLASSVLTAWLAFFVAVLAVHLLLGQMLSQDRARMGTFLFAWSPASIFFMSTYPEGLLIALSAVALYMIGVERYWFAALSSGLATACAPMAIGIPCALGFALLARWRLKPASLVKTLGLCAVAVSGLIGWMLYLLVRFHDPILFAKEQKTFNRSMSWPFLSTFGVLVNVGGNTHSPGIPSTNWFDTRLINLVFSLVGLIVFAYFIFSMLRPRGRQFSLWFGVYAIVTALIPAISTQKFGGVPNPEGGTRLTCQNLGLYAFMSRLLKSYPSWRFPVLGCWLALAVVVQCLFTNGFYFT